ncbi:class I SAM-dependent methyltransferase [Bdellovibrionales bacterium]|nr:class I SAM-dependent methyltransferase [Bdellovibrionales bacterium]
MSALRSLKSHQLVRQDRIHGKPDQDFIRIENNNIPVVNFNSFGLLVQTELELPKEVVDAEFYSYGKLISQIELNEVRSYRDSKTDQRFIAYSIVGDPIRVEKVLALEKATEVISGSREYADLIAMVPLNFRTKTFEIRTKFIDLKQRIEDVEPDPFELYRSEIDEYENTICAEVAHYIRDNIADAFEILGKLLFEFDEETKKASIDFFREQVGAIIYQAPYPRRALEKPRGYAGDFDMMISTYRLENRGHNLFAKCLHRYFVEEEAPKAVRNRAVYLQKKLVHFLKENPKANILSVACGPAVEIENILLEHQDLLQEGPSFHFLDQDEEALKSAQQNLVSVKNRQELDLKLSFHHRAIKDVISKGLQDLKFDFIYSAGLFDYLTAPVAQFAASRLYDHLNPGGQLIIGNFSVDNPNQYGMVLTMDWKLIYRTTEEMRAIVGNLQGDIEIESEDLGINLFAVLKKPLEAKN